ncbi:metallophosphoesterase [Paenibacillus sp. NRS-1783]|uniref:metallophosphoesterase n=1 Tax=Paenibacillus sp. NRS-1783 TaxID=3233907 RepID=UPI003D26669E
MVLSIIHLTDIHLSMNQTNSILDKKNELIRAIISEVRNAEHVIIIVSGDIANYGLEDEYENYALPLFMEIKDEIQMEISDLILEFFFIPGNHDCDFSNKEEMEIRDALIKVISTDKLSGNKSTFIDQIKRQNNFEVIKEIFHDEWKKSVLIVNNQIYEKVELLIDDKKIIFNLFNSSWISTIREQPGQMYYPVQYTEKIACSSRGEINFSVIHHPTHWLNPDNKREMDDLLVRISDFILTGHEHVPSKVIVTDWSNRSVTYIEGSAIQELGTPNISGFNVIHLNLESMQFCVKNFLWNSLYYESNEGDEDWKSIIQESAVKLAKPNSLKLLPEFSEFINDLAIQITHPRAHNLLLSDIYVYPNLEEIIYEDEDVSYMKLDEIAEVVNQDKSSHLFFTGDKDSGKTALGKMLFRHFYGERYYPLHIDGHKLTQSLVKDIPRLLRSMSKNIYNDETMYIQLQKSQRVLIIDDWNKIPVNNELKSKFLNEARKYFSQVIILAESNSSFSESVRMFSSDNDYSIRHFEIMGFGHVKRNEFIEKWVCLGQRDTIENSELLREIDRINRAMKPILMQSYVPKFPLYLLIIIKTVEAGKPHNFEKSSNAYYFEVLIKDALSSLEIDNSETDKIYQYLTDLSYEMLKLNKSLTIDQWRKFHRGHLEYYDMTDDQIAFKEIKSKLEREKIIKLGSSGYEYNYSYMFYFFVAQYIARKINQEQIRQLVKDMCRSIHIADNANIIMFLTHLSKDDYIKAEVLNAAKNIFQDIPHLKLEEDVALINSLCEELSPLILNDVDVREHRRKLDEQMDENERSTMLESRLEVSAVKELNENANEATLVMERVNLIDQGFKMLDIIGQILKNYYGSLSGTDKYDLCEELFKLGLRINYSFISDLRDNNKPLVEYISSIIIDKKIENNNERAEKTAKKIIYFMGGIITFNSIGKIALSVGTKDLDQTYLKVKDSLSCNSADLAYLFIQLEYYYKFPYNEVKKIYQDNKTNKIAIQILQQMVRRYLYMYETNRAERQRICDLVGMKINHNQKLQPKKVTQSAHLFS